MKYCSICNEKFDDSLSFCPKDGEVLEEDSGSLVGKALDGQYQIEAMLGKGGMGAVYRARHILLGDRVAIKVLPPEMRGNTEWLRRFQREGQAARRFRHPNAVTVYDLRTSGDGTIYLVMEYVEGNTLDAELKKRGKFTPAEALTVLTPVMSVLNAAHAMGVVHRDLKPENIMIGKPATGGEPTVKLLDLGIAKLREVAGSEPTGSTNLTVAGQMLGTPYYMSPEQWGELPDDGNHEIDGRADIYSLGVVIYELIAGKRPFTGFSLPELRRQHISMTPPRLHEVDANVPLAFSDAVAKSIAKDRSERQSTAGELEQQLTAALAAEGIAPSDSVSEFASAPPVPSRGAVTSPQQTAATIVTGINETEPVRSPATIQSQAATMPTVVSQAAEPTAKPSASAAAIAAAATSEAMAAAATAPPIATPPAKGKGSALIFAGVGLVVLLLIAGVGGYFVMHAMMSKPESTAKTDSSSNTSGADVAGAHEVGRYWLQVNSTSEASSIRADEQLQMASGQQFRFHFSPSESGYLYIIGPGDGNVPTIFLSGKPASEFGVKNNEIQSGQDFVFPVDSKTNYNWMNLDNTPGTDEFTLIFSGTRLTTPAFLDQAALHQLSNSEQAELNQAIAGFKSNLAGTEVMKNAPEPFVSVKVPQSAAEGAPVVFKIKIAHK
ncbi:MAG TPA: protein kinase [Pyrinomonadaceae bacterium]|jgi:serine/threonine-protein kinase|nr:protein kinase [Pyrinomonadaceae bacterium]